MDTDAPPPSSADPGLTENEQRLAFLAQAGLLLPASLDLDTTLANISRFALPFFADLCVVDLPADDDQPAQQIVATASLPPPAAPWWPAPSSSEHAVLLESVPPAASTAGVRSAIAVPLAGRERILGMLVFATTDDSGRRFMPADLPLAEGLAARAAVALENARRFQEAQHRADSAAQRDRQAETARTAGEARYRSLISATTQLIWATNAAGCLTDWHDWHMYTGQPVTQIAGSEIETWLLGAVVEVDHPLVSERFLRSLAAGTVCEVECRLRRFDGEVLYFALRSVPVRDEETGRVREWVGAGTNITERREAEAAREAALARETRIARTLQRALLVKPPGDAFAGLEFETLYQPAHDEMLVGGDFYDAFLLDGDRVAFVVGDVSGKGLEAAAHTAELKFTLRALLRDADGPEQAVSRLNDYLRGSDRYAGSSLPGHLIALTVAVIPTSGGEAEFVVAGMEPPLILRAGVGTTGGRRTTAVATALLRAETVPADGLPLGVLPPDALPSWDREHRAARAAFGPGDLLLLCTDGLTEARRHGTRAEFFGQEGVTAAAQNAAGRPRRRPASLEEIGIEVIRAAQDFAGGRLRDDVCLLLARRRPPAA